MSARPRPGADERAAGAAPGPAGRRLMRAAVVVPLLLVAFAGAIRVYRLATPPTTYGDETFYANDAWAYLGGMLPLPNRVVPPAPTIEAETSWGHPPLGKWLIALGEGATQNSPFGRRLPSAVFGTAGVLLAYLVALELWASIGWAALAGGLVALDGLHIVQSRIAMLDIFLSTFVLAGVYFLLRDRRAMREPAPIAPTRLERWFGTRDRFWAGAMFGAAVAVKWNGAWALVLGFALTVVAVRRHHPPGDDRRRAAVRGAVRAFVVVPFVVYLAAYAQFFVQHPFDVAGFAKLQWYMFDATRGDHYFIANTSPAWTWPLLLHPIRYWPGLGQTGADPTRGSILALGNPVLFWAFLAAVPVALRRALRRAGDATARLPLAFYGVMFVPWLLVSRSQYFYYVLPCVPFMALVLVGVLRELPARVARRAGVAVGALACGVAVLFVPVWLGLPASAGRLALLHWLPRWH